MSAKAANKIADGLHEAIGYAQGWNAATEAAAKIAHQKASALVCGRNRTNQVDRHVSGVLCRLRDDILAMKTK